MRILHIINDFEGSKVHKNLVTRLDKLGVQQIIFVPTSYLNRNKQKSELQFYTKDSRVIYSDVQKKYHKYLFSSKILYLYNSLTSHDDLSLETVDLIHASTWCSDGSLALKISKKINKPFIVSIRDTDLNVHFKLLWWKRKHFKNILIKSSKLIFISKAYRRKFFTVVGEDLSSVLNKKTVIINNGVDDLFLDNIRKRINYRKSFKIVYLGAVIPRKNILSIIKAIEKLREEQVEDFSLDIIGAGYKNRDDPKYLEILRDYANSVEWVNIYNSMSTDRLIYKLPEYDMLVVPSKTETFGLIYLEALTQGMPVIYSRDEGFDGVFEDGEIGYAVDPNSFIDLSEKILGIISNYDGLLDNIAKIDFSRFAWDNIAKRYFHEYEESIEKEY